jgi:hypothetical protein
MESAEEKAHPRKKILARASKVRIFFRSKRGKSSVADPDPVGSEYYLLSWIRIRIQQLKN